MTHESDSKRRFRNSDLGIRIWEFGFGNSDFGFRVAQGLSSYFVGQPAKPSTSRNPKSEFRNPKCLFRVAQQARFVRGSEWHLTHQLHEIRNPNSQIRDVFFVLLKKLVLFVLRRAAS